VSSRDVLRDEHESLQRAVRVSRQAAEQLPETQFVRDMRQVMDDYLEARGRGMSREEGVSGIETVLRESWLHRPTKFGPNCQECDDLGWLERVCSADARCGRKRCATGHPSVEHRYVEPCFCPKGDARAGRNQPAQDLIAAAMRVSKPKQRSFSRLGR
jgi:hypothetical protein